MMDALVRVLTWSSTYLASETMKKAMIEKIVHSAHFLKLRTCSTVYSSRLLILFIGGWVLQFKRCTSVLPRFQNSKKSGNYMVAILPKAFFCSNLSDTASILPTYWGGQITIAITLWNMIQMHLFFTFLM